MISPYYITVLYYTIIVYTNETDFAALSGWIHWELGQNSSLGNLGQLCKIGQFCGINMSWSSLGLNWTQSLFWANFDKNGAIATFG